MIANAMMLLQQLGVTRAHTHTHTAHATDTLQRASTKHNQVSQTGSTNRPTDPTFRAPPAVMQLTPEMKRCPVQTMLAGATAARGAWVLVTL